MANKKDIYLTIVYKCRSHRHRLRPYFKLLQQKHVLLDDSLFISNIITEILCESEIAESFLDYQLYSFEDTESQI